MPAAGGAASSSAVPAAAAGGAAGSSAVPAAAASSSAMAASIPLPFGKSDGGLDPEILEPHPRRIDPDKSIFVSHSRPISSSPSMSISSDSSDGGSFNALVAVESPPRGRASSSHARGRASSSARLLSTVPSVGKRNTSVDLTADDPIYDRRTTLRFVIEAVHGHAAMSRISAQHGSIVFCGPLVVFVFSSPFFDHGGSFDHSPRSQNDPVTAARRLVVRDDEGYELEFLGSGV